MMPLILLVLLTIPFGTDSTRPVWKQVCLDAPFLQDSPVDPHVLALLQRLYPKLTMTTWTGSNLTVVNAHCEAL
jgi:hypothetical protein